MKKFLDKYLKIINIFLTIGLILLIYFTTNFSTVTGKIIAVLLGVVILLCVVNLILVIKIRLNKNK